jgi:integrase/recombinase XerD
MARVLRRRRSHELSVLSVFYDFLAGRGEGPVMNPVPTTGVGPRRYAHHNPLEEYGPHRRALYRQRIPQSPPRALPDDTVNRLFSRLTCHRDRAMVAMYLASGVRASELLGMRGRDVDWGNSMIAVVSKGTRAYQQVPTSPDTLTWLRLYLSEGFDAPPDEPLWWTLRGPRRALQYTAVRAMLRRVTAGLDSHVTFARFPSHLRDAVGQRSEHPAHRCPGGVAARPDHHHRRIHPTGNCRRCAPLPGTPATPR